MASVGVMTSPTGGLSPAFSPFSESPNSPAPYGNSFQTKSNRSSGPSDNLAPPSPYPQHTDPSPTDSNGTERTEIEEEVQDDVKSPLSNGELQSPELEIASPQSAQSNRVSRIDTQLPAMMRSDSSEEPNSVIHAPDGFKNFDGNRSNQQSPTQSSENTVMSPETPEATGPGGKKLNAVSPVNTDIPRINDRSTPRAQTRQELEDDRKRRSRRASSLPGRGPRRTLRAYADQAIDIPEKENVEEDDDPDTAGLVTDGRMSTAMEASLKDAEEEVKALRAALSECWTLCNTLAALSSSHRQRTFKFSGKQDMQETAWKNCWRLCQQLYESRDEDHALQVLPTLELCREFCQSLFEARQKTDEASDSVLRVSFELNNHLYNTHDRSLPEAFNERTLDFYITMCHRLMKQRTSLPQETDALLCACWSLAEMLFNVRQNNREGKSSDEELLGSAVQACWELCDLFRAGWTQIRPERGTPRPSQVVFHNTFPRRTSYKSTTSSHSEARSNSSMSNRQYHDAPVAPIEPETPTTIFDDATSTTSSPDSGIVPNILVLGPAKPGSSSGGSTHERWSSNASVLSGYSESASSRNSSSTATASSEEAHLARLRYLLLKAGMHTGYTRASGEPLPTHVKSLPSSAFGTLPWQTKVLEYYKKLVLGDKSMMIVHKLPSRRLGAAELAKSVKWLGSGEQWAWMRDLYRLVLGFGIDEAHTHGGAISV